MAEFSLVWLANVYMGIFGRIRLDPRKERAEIAAEKQVSPALSSLRRWSSQYFKRMKPVLMR